MRGKFLALAAVLATVSTAAWAHCCCDRHHHRHARAAHGGGWETARFEFAAGRPCDNYPASALRARASGVTWVKLRMDEDGFVAASRVSRSSGRADLDRAAMACVAGWHLGHGREWRVARIVWRWHWIS